MREEPKNKIILYKADDGKTKIEVKLDGETVWLSQRQIAELFQTTIPNINQHVLNVLREKELEEMSTIKKSLTVQREGTRDIKRNVVYYNLDMIISVGYRINSLRGTQFRIWATQKLKEYIVKGFVMDDERLSEGRIKKDYFTELLERVRKIRASEKNLYEKVREIFATSVDYNSKSKTTKEFYATIQNRFHYAITGSTAAELVTKRIDRRKENLGLTNWKGEIPTRKEAEVAKNYMLETELRQLHLLVEQFLSFCEFQIERKNVMYTKDWLDFLRNMLEANRLEVLFGKGKVSHEEMEKKVKEELEKFIEKRRIK